MTKKQGSIAERIRRAREIAQMGPAAIRQALSERGINLSKTGLHRLETIEPKNPNVKIIEAIADITNVSPSWILFGEGPSVPENDLGDAIRSRIIDTMELMSNALELTARQEMALNNWLKSVRNYAPTKRRKP